MAKSAFSSSLENALSSAGDMLITGFRGVSSADPEVTQIQRYIEQGKIAGVILLRRNIRSPEQLERLNASLQSAAGDLPLIVAIDQEGGAVARVGPKTGFMHWQSAADLGLMGLSNQDIYDYYFVRAAELQAVGINLNLAPVVDLNVNPASAIIGALGRSYSANVETVVRYAELFIRAHRATGLLTCGKHFPGHGSAYSDSHLGAADVSQTWHSKEIAPFERLAQAGLLDSIMTAHVLHSYMSDDPWIPVSLSEKSVFEIRDGLRFAGPVVTDDLQMGAITTLMSPEQASIPAVKAGNTFLIYSNYADQYSLETIETVHPRLNAALKTGRLNPISVAQQISTARAFRSALVNRH